LALKAISSFLNRSSSLWNRNGVQHRAGKQKEEHDDGKGKQIRTMERERNVTEGTVWDNPYGITDDRNISQMDQNIIP